jgi:hypothetical protein
MENHWLQAKGGGLIFRTLIGLQLMRSAYFRKEKTMKVNVFKYFRQMLMVLAKLSALTRSFSYHSKLPKNPTAVAVGAVGGCMKQCCIYYLMCTSVENVNTRYCFTFREHERNVQHCFCLLLTVEHEPMQGRQEALCTCNIQHHGRATV